MTELATALGVSPSLLKGVLIALAYLACKATSRLIPDTATGWQGKVRDIAGIISVDISSRVAPGMTIATIAKAALETPPITAKVEAATGVPVPELELAASQILSPPAAQAAPAPFTSPLETRP